MHMTTNNNLRQIRRSKHLSQSELADMISKDRTVISKYETGKIKIDIETICKLAEVLKVPTSAIIPELKKKSV